MRHYEAPHENPYEGDLTPNPEDACMVCDRIECICPPDDTLSDIVKQSAIEHGQAFAQLPRA